MKAEPCGCDFPRADRRTARTRASLSGALIVLLHERGWEDIGIAELCSRAGIARSTFYLHYANKEEVVESGFAALRETIRAAAPSDALARQGRFGFAGGVAQHIFDNRKTFLALSGGSSIVRERFRVLLTKMIDEEMSQAGRADPALAQFLGGGFLALAAHVMGTKTGNAAEFETRFQRLAAAAFAAA